MTSADIGSNHIIVRDSMSSSNIFIDFKQECDNIVRSLLFTSIRFFGNQVSVMAMLFYSLKELVAIQT